MLGRGRYSQHQQLKMDDDSLEDLNNDDDNSVDEIKHRVIYIGKEYIPNFCEQNYGILVKKIYGQNFSTLNALSQSKKLELVVQPDCIKLHNNTSTTFVKLGSFSHHHQQHSNVFATFTLNDLVYMSTDLQHKKVLAVVSKGFSNDATLSVLICEDVNEPLTIMDECSRFFTQQKHIVKEIQRNKLPDALKIIKNQQGITRTIDNPAPALLADTSFIGQDFGDFQSSGQSQSFSNASTNDLSFPINSINKNKSTVKTDISKQQTHQQQLQTLNVDDEFSQLALKRNIYLPDHLQDKTVESSMLIQEQHNTFSKQQPVNSERPLSPGDDADENRGNRTKKRIFKPNFFSSYTSVSTG